MDRAILHSDINSCYASIERLYEPRLCGRPFAVCGAPELRHGIVLSKDDIAKKAGVKTGMAIWQAKCLCPELEIVLPHFERYTEYADAVRSIYYDYTNLCEPFGLDECWLDLTGCLACPDPVETAHEIRRRVKKETGLTVSIGVSFNKIFAKLGSDYRKSDAVTVIDRENYKSIVWGLPASDMLMVGRSTARQLERMGIRTIGELAAASPESLHAVLGKAGPMLHAFANGADTTAVRRVGDEPPPKSVGNSTTLPRDVETLRQAEVVILSLAESVGTRLRRGGYMCRSLELSLRTEELTWTRHRMRLFGATDVTLELRDMGMRLLSQAWTDRTPLRSMGLCALELVPTGVPEQLDILYDYVNSEKQKKIDAAVDGIRKKYGAEAIQRASVFGNSVALGKQICTLPEKGFI